jgi:hypothetical protein
MVNNIQFLVRRKVILADTDGIHDQAKEILQKNDTEAMLVYQVSR